MKAPITAACIDPYKNVEEEACRRLVVVAREKMALEEIEASLLSTDPYDDRSARLV